jgi:type VI protein secretion system component VasK
MVKDILAAMNPTRWAIAGAVLLALIGALWGIYAAGQSSGRAQVSAAWDKAKAEAQAAQDAKTDKAAEVLVQEVEVVRTVYRDRIKEVKTYVPTPGTACPADPQFVRLFNAAR